MQQLVPDQARQLAATLGVEHEYGATEGISAETLLQEQRQAAMSPAEIDGTLGASVSIRDVTINSGRVPRITDWPRSSLAGLARPRAPACPTARVCRDSGDGTFAMQVEAEYRLESA